ncbi:putative leucine-rich repeat domain superfamily, F-box-like domain superfamily [Helianthus debilis subsp. tardiflorus]
MDGISYLPDFILHHILSFCNTPAELVRMSVLSKSWFNLSASFPCLDFNIRYFRTRESFFKYVEYTTSRFCQQNVTASAHRLKLRATLQEPTELDIVNRCLERVLNKGARELEIDITNSSDVSKYRLPDILLSVSGLESLTIRGCYLPSSFMLDVVHFKSLIQLKLENVPMDDEVIKHLTASCPLLQNFEIRWCHGFKRFCHQNLRKVWIYYNVRVERIDIEAPNLSYLFIEDRDGRGAPRMNLASCRKLTTVSYFGNDFTGFLSQFPFIENLYLATKFIGNSLMLASHSLRTLVLHSNCDLDNIELSTPNLDLFIYSCNPRLLRQPLGDKPGPPVRDLAHLKSCMQCYPHDCIDALWFVKLRLFFDKENGFKVLNLYIRAICGQKLSKLEKLKAIELPPYELEHVELQLDTHEESSAHVAFVDAVLWCCRPRSLTLRSSVPYEEQSDVVKFTFKKLLEQEDQGHTKIQIVSPSSAEAQKHLMDLKSLSMALPREGKKISFIKEEGTLFYQLIIYTFFTSLVNT